MMNGVGRRSKAFDCQLHRELEPMIINGFDSGCLSFLFSELSSWADVITATKAINTADKTKRFTFTSPYSTECCGADSGGGHQDVDVVFTYICCVVMTAAVSKAS